MIEVKDWIVLGIILTVVFAIIEIGFKLTVSGIGIGIGFMIWGGIQYLIQRNL